MEKNYSLRLKRLLEELNIKQVELAEKTGVTEATISNYINGKQLPKLGVVEKIAEILNVSVDYMLCNTEFKNPQNDMGGLSRDELLCAINLYKNIKNIIKIEKLCY